jgi:hypothetical protein
MRASHSGAVIFSIMFGVSLLLPSSIGAEQTRPAPDRDPRESGETLRSGGYELQTDWSRFRRIMVHPIDIAYTTDFKNARHKDQPSEISSEDLERVRRYFQRAFQKRLGRDYPITTDRGPDVLRVDAVLVNPVLDKSWWLQPGKSIYRGESGVSLVVVLRDSESGTPLHRVNLPLRVGSLGFEDSALNYWSYIRLIFDRIAARVVWALDDAPDGTHS